MRNFCFSGASAVILSLLSTHAFAHPGGMARSGPLAGCHADRTAGNFHCHAGPLAGRSWSTREEALKATGAGADMPSAAPVDAPPVDAPAGPAPAESSAPAPVAAYERSYFHHWIDANGDCLSTRQEVLKARSEIPVTLKETKRGLCLVASGRWKDFYFDEMIERAVQADIDHVVPLKHAWESGAAAWTSARREEFANDPDNLVITNLKYNREKGAKTILEWMPIDRGYACRYVERWFRVKAKYGLAVSPAEKEYRKRVICAKEAVVN